MLLKDFLPFLPIDITNIINGYIEDSYIYFDEKNDNNRKIKVNMTKLTCNCYMFKNYRYFCKHMQWCFSN
jgi:hypothetical protein